MADGATAYAVSAGVTACLIIWQTRKRPWKRALHECARFRFSRIWKHVLAGGTRPHAWGIRAICSFKVNPLLTRPHAWGFGLERAKHPIIGRPSRD